jgi:hypothetical protein
MSKLLKTAAKIGLAYFILFTIFYVGRFIYAMQAFIEYHSRPTGVDIAHTIFAGTIVFEKDVTANSGSILFTITALLAVIGAGIWMYQTVRGNQSATVS